MTFRRLLLALSLFAPAIAADAELSKGHRILVERGLLVQGMVSHTDPFSLTTYSNANYSAINLFWDPAPSHLGVAPGFPWTRWARNQAEMPPGEGEVPYMSQLVTLQLGDEWELNNDTVRNQVVDWFDAVRSNYPDTILFHNNYGGQVGDAQLYDFYSRAQPDMLSFDTYPWIVTGDGTPRPEYLGYWYSDMRRYREHAKGANLPLACYLQTFNSTSDNARKPSRSELRMQVFVALAFNCKVLIDFTYNTGASSLFTNSHGGDNAPNELYYEKADCNRRARNFGNALVRLKPIADAPYPDLRTTSMVQVRGRDPNGTPNSFPIGFQPDPEDGNNYTDWAFGRNDPYLTSWEVTNVGTRNNGQRGDVFISWFTPLDESFDGPEYTNEVYLMVVNALHDITGTPADCAQQIRLNFAPDLVAVEMLNPLTGFVEATPLPLVNGFRQLVLNLDGGDAALLKFATGAPFLGVESTGAPVVKLHPANRVVVAGGNATFAARASGAGPLNYQWQLNGVNIPGATSNTWTLSSAQLADAGAYTMIASNALGTATTAPAILSVVSPTLLLYEPFDYANVGGPVSSNTPANWATGGSGANDLQVAAGNLSYPGLAASAGNSVTNGGAGLGVRRLLGTNVNGGQLFFSALFRINDLGYGAWNGGASQVGALLAPDNTAARLQVMVRSNSPSAYGIGVQKGGTGSTATFLTNDFRTNQMVFLVGRYDFATSPNTVSLWVNPDPASFGAAVPPADGFVSATTGPDGFAIDRFNMRQNTTATVPAAMQWDELRVGRTWADVTPAGAPVRLLSIAALDDGQLRLEATADPGTLRVEVSTNLLTWSELVLVGSTNGRFEYLEPRTHAAGRFYRLKRSP